MALKASGASFTFACDKGSLSADVTGLSVETPEAKIVDMTPAAAVAANVKLLVPTGEYDGGTIRVDYIAKAGQTNPSLLNGGVGIVSFSSPDYTVVRRVILRRASEEARVGDIVRGTLEFSWTDYFP